MLRLDHNRAASQLAAKTGFKVGDIEADRVGQPLADHVRRLPLRDGRWQSVKDAINDQAWNKDVFLPTVGKRGAAIIAARGLSSAASAANAAIDHMRDWALGTKGGGSRWACPATANTASPRTWCSASR